MFPKDLMEWQGKVHESPVGDLPTITLKGFLKHYTCTDFDQYNKLKNKSKTLFLGFFAFFKMYVLKKVFLEGWLSFVLCLNYADYTLQKYVKLK